MKELMAIGSNNIYLNEEFYTDDVINILFISLSSKCSVMKWDVSNISIAIINETPFQFI